MVKNENYKLLYDFNWPFDISQITRLVYVDKQIRQTYSIDVVCVMERNVLLKEKEKMEKDLNLMTEL